MCVRGPSARSCVGFRVWGVVRARAEARSCVGAHLSVVRWRHRGNHPERGAGCGAGAEVRSGARLAGKPVPLPPVRGAERVRNARTRRVVRVRRLWVDQPRLRRGREARHRCSRCGHEEAHTLLRVNRWVDVGAWDSTWGPYEVEQEFEECTRCGFERATGPPDFDRRRGRLRGGRPTRVGVRHAALPGTS